MYMIKMLGLEFIGCVVRDARYYTGDREILDSSVDSYEKLNCRDSRRVVSLIKIV